MKSVNRIYEVLVSYNVESVDAAKAIDKVLASSPMVPITINAEPSPVECDEYDD